MEKELYMKNKKQKPVVIQHDDLKFDGENIVIPSYYDSVIYDYLKYVDTTEMSDADIEDYKAFKQFFSDIIDYKTDNGGN